MIKKLKIVVSRFLILRRFKLKLVKEDNPLAELEFLTNFLIPEFFSNNIFDINHSFNFVYSTKRNIVKEIKNLAYLTLQLKKHNSISSLLNTEEQVLLDAKKYFINENGSYVEVPLSIMFLKEALENFISIAKEIEVSEDYMDKTNFLNIQFLIQQLVDTVMTVLSIYLGKDNRLEDDVTSQST